jgi:hypothetical protein
MNGYFSEVFIVSIYFCVISIKDRDSRVVPRRPISKQTLHSLLLDREDRRVSHISQVSEVQNMKVFMAFKDMKVAATD